MDSPTYPPHLRVGKNRGGYAGERIEIYPLLREIESLASQREWESKPLILANGTQLPGYSRISSQASRTIYLSAGIHGDEPAGPCAMRQLLDEDRWPDRFSYWIIPCLNPGGFERNTRENESGIDLNRDYRSQKTELVRAHIRWLDQIPRIDLSLLLHEDWESNGFYLYELNPDQHPSLSPHMVQAVSEVCPIELATQIEGRDAERGMIRFIGNIPEREDWPEALYMAFQKSRLNFTLEAPSDFVLPTRVAALCRAIHTALEVF